MQTASLVLNIVVLIPVLILLFSRTPRAAFAFGPDTASRQILTSMYLTILIGSLYLLTIGAQNHGHLVAGLLLFQIFYKFISVIFIKDKKNPVLWTNGMIAAFHSLTLWLSAN